VYNEYSCEVIRSTITTTNSLRYGLEYIKRKRAKNHPLFPPPDKQVGFLLATVVAGSKNHNNFYQLGGFLGLFWVSPGSLGSFYETRFELVRA
jgi:hypothetical protein